MLDVCPRVTEEEEKERKETANLRPEVCGIIGIGSAERESDAFLHVAVLITGLVVPGWANLTFTPFLVITQLLNFRSLQ